MPPRRPDTPAGERPFEVHMLEHAIGMRSWEWPGRCFDVARALLRETGLEGRAVYGFWTGPVIPSVVFDGAEPRVRHGWVVTGPGLIIDPTRFVFERVAPYIYHGPNDYYADGQAINWQVTAPSRYADTPRFRARPRSRTGLKTVRVRQRPRTPQPAKR